MRALTGAHDEVRGGPAAVAVAGLSYWADAAFLASRGIPTVLFGPGGEGAHAEVEWVSRLHPHPRRRRPAAVHLSLTGAISSRTLVPLPGRLSQLHSSRSRRRSPTRSTTDSQCPAAVSPAVSRCT